jgi:hypothetical protein
MKSTLFVIAVFLTVVGLGYSPAATSTLLAQAKSDLTGEWAFDVQTDQGGGTPTFIFKQTGDKLAGRYKGQFGEADLTGTVTGKTFKFSFSADAQGQKVTISYDGEIESPSTVKGKLDIAGLATGTFTGKKVK